MSDLIDTDDILLHLKEYKKTQKEKEIQKQEIAKMAWKNRAFDEMNCLKTA